MTTHSETSRAVDDLIEELAATGQPFSAAGMRDRLFGAAERAAVPHRLRLASQAGVIERIGSATTRHGAGHGRAIGLWRGVQAHAPAPERDTLRAKAAKLLSEGRVTVLTAGDGQVEAVVRSELSVHQVTAHDGRWHCGCNAQDECSHIIAVAMVTGNRP